MEDNLLGIAGGILFLQLIIVIWFTINNGERKAEHEKLKAELAQRLFVRVSSYAQYDLRSILGELLNHLNCEIEEGSGIKIVKTNKKGIK